MLEGALAEDLFEVGESVLPDDRTAHDAKNSSSSNARTGHVQHAPLIMYNTLLKLLSQNGKEQMADGRRPDILRPLACHLPSAICHLPSAICHFLFAFLDSVDPVDVDGRESCSDYFFAWPSAKAWSKSRPGDLKPIFSLTKRAASAAPCSRSMPGSSHSTDIGPV